MRFSGLEGCVRAAVTGRVPHAAPGWCGGGVRSDVPDVPLRRRVAAPLAPLAPLAVAPARRALHTYVAPAAVRTLEHVLVRYKRA